MSQPGKTSAEKSWRETFGHLWPVACRAARRLLSNPADVEDIAATAISQYAQLPSRPANLDESGALVAVIARRAAIAFWRKQNALKRGAEQPTPLHLLDEGAVPAPAVAPGIEYDLAALLDTLPPLRRQIVREHFLEGRNSAEIGERHGLNPATVRSHLLRAMQELRKL